VEYECSWDVSDASSPLGSVRDAETNNLANRISSFAAFLLDVHTRRKTTRRGTYILPEDDQDAQRLNELKPARVRAEGYDAPSEQNQGSSSIFDSDIGYHNRYGESEHEPQVVPRGPLGGHRENTNMGYHNRFFHD